MVWSDDCIVLSPVDVLIIIAGEKATIFEYYLPIDLEIPTVGSKLGSVWLADPKCFGQLTEMCREIIKESIEKAQRPR